MDTFGQMPFGGHFETDGFGGHFETDGFGGHFETDVVWWTL